MTDKPPAEWILPACADVALPRSKHAAGEAILRRLIPLAGGQEAILQRVGWGAVLSGQLEMQPRGH